jgi:hypothetical protein
MGSNSGFSAWKKPVEILLMTAGREVRYSSASMFWGQSPYCTLVQGRESGPQPSVISDGRKNG